MIEDFAAIAVLCTVIGFFAYTQVPKHWQTLAGFLLIVFGWMPAAIVVLCIMKQPVLLVPAVFVIGVFTAYRKRRA